MQGSPSSQFLFQLNVLGEEFATTMRRASMSLLNHARILRHRCVSKKSAARRPRLFRSASGTVFERPGCKALLLVRGGTHGMILFLLLAVNHAVELVSLICVERLQDSVLRERAFTVAEEEEGAPTHVANRGVVGLNLRRLLVSIRRRFILSRVEVSIAQVPVGCGPARRHACRRSIVRD